MTFKSVNIPKIDRREFTLGLTGLMAASLVTACNSPQATSAVLPSVNPTPPPTQEIEIYSMVAFLKGSEFFNWSYAGMRDAAKRLGQQVQTEYHGPVEWDASLEARAIEELIERKVAGLVVTAGDAGILVPAINKAIEAGIPVITFDSDSPASKRLSFVGTDNYQAGFEAGQTIAAWLEGRGQVAVSTFPGPDHLAKRVQGFEDALAQLGPEIELVALVNDDGKTEKAETQFMALLQANPHISAIFAAHGNPGPGVAAAVQKVGLEGKVSIMAFDFALPVIELVEKGVIRATVGQNPYLMGYQSMMLAYAAGQETGVPSASPGFGPVPARIDTGVRILGKAEIGLYKNPPQF
jgi:ribose transport system substrate-binding protein